MFVLTVWTAAWAGPASPRVLLTGLSGSGKTVLLNMITLVRGAGAPHGTVTLNGHPVSISIYPAYFAFVGTSGSGCIVESDSSCLDMASTTNLRIVCSISVI